LREPAPPDVFVEKFWPVFALTFNDVESETELFRRSPTSSCCAPAERAQPLPAGDARASPSRAAALGDAKGLIDEEGSTAFKAANPFDVVLLNKDPQTKITDVLEVVPVPGVDPNLYATEQFSSGPRQLTVGTSEAATAASQGDGDRERIAANSTLASDDTSRRRPRQLPLPDRRAPSPDPAQGNEPEQVKQIVGPGAVWPSRRSPEIANEIYLEVEAGSTGRPNQAVEIDNFTKLAPILFQIPGMSAAWMAKQAIRRLDDRLDVNEGLMENAPSIVAQNANKQVAGPTPAADPNAAGRAGRAECPSTPAAGEPRQPRAFGSNQISSLYPCSRVYAFAAYVWTTTTTYDKPTAP
jgi:hypothetical protein